MDIEQYLQQKRGLEKKKEYLEAKTKLNETKEEAKKERVRSFQQPTLEEEQRPSRPYEHPPEPVLKPWMIWDIMVIIIVLVLFSVTYFFPLTDMSTLKQQITDDLKSNLVTGNAVLQQPAPQPAQQQLQETPPAQQQTPPPPLEPEKENLPGPEFTLTLSDEKLGDFDESGKIDNKIVIVQNTEHYSDIFVTLQNEENTPIKCFIDRKVNIDTDFNNDYDAADISINHAIIEIPKLQKDKLKDGLPGPVEQGTYNGRGKILATYEARCFFCIDDECESIEENGKEVRKATLKAIINSPTLNSNNTSSN